MRKIVITSLLFFILTFGFESSKSYAFDQVGMFLTNPQEETKISISEGRLVIENLDADSVLEVYSIVGVKVYSIKVKAGTNEYPLNLPKGYYIIRIGSIAKKIALR